MGVHQFLRGEISTAHVKQTGLPLFVKRTLSLRYVRVDVISPHQGARLPDDPCCS